MPLILGAQSAISAGYSIDNSCRFNENDDAKLVRTQTAGDRTKWTLSMWVKNGRLSASGETRIFAFGGDADDPGFLVAGFMFPNRFNSYNYLGSATLGHLQTSNVYNDQAAWYHLVLVWDTGAAAANRMRLYTNGVEETAFAIDANPALNQVGTVNDSGHSFVIGSTGFNTIYNFDGYIAEAILCDGQAYGPTDFGEFNSDSPTIWQPIDPSGLTFGTNGFWLDFEDSADLGADVSGEGNDFTVTNLTASDQGVDSPTNNFCTTNPLGGYFGLPGTYSQGNCKWVSGGGGTAGYTISTVGLTAGKWYCEIKPKTSATMSIGITDKPQPDSSENPAQTNYGIDYQNDGEYQLDGGSATSFADSYTTDDIVGLYLDLDNNKFYVGKNGTVQNSGTGISITGISAMTAPTNAGQGCYFISGCKTNGGSTFEFNFGGCSAFDVSSAQQDANGYGNFEYSPSDGGSASFDGSAKDFLAICTKNLGSDGG